ncbi:MAG: ATP-binding protein [Bacteroidales bacterium]|nr:ATP-binding protein [Bacteroidales bacterium]
MENPIIGRKREQEALKTCVNSSKSELIAVYGRRRVGKTYLIKKYFSERFDFYFTGSLNKTKREMLMLFNEQLQQYSQKPYPIAKTWHESLNQLKDYVLSLRKDKVVIFIDEISWIDNANSGFLSDFEYFWNSWAATYGKIKLIICASATSWILDKVLADKGGLHNRVTKIIGLNPFTLGETEEFFRYKNVKFNRFDIAQCYMIMGGVPYYLDLIDPKLGLPQNIDALFFGETAELRREFDFLYRSLFNNYDFYIKVIECISQKNKGLTRQEIAESLKLQKGGNLTKALRELENCGFVRRYNSFGKKERGALYQVVDFYTLFWLKFCKNRKENDPEFFSKLTGSPVLNSWLGYSFEILSLCHVSQIKRAIGINGIITGVCSWSTPADKEYGTLGVQIDLVIDRNDNTINLCEMKFSRAKFAVTKKYYELLGERAEIFRNKTKTSKSLHTVLVTTFGLKQNAYSSAFQTSVVLDDLFEKAK